MDHLLWHKPRLVMLGPKIEALLDDHPSKAQCLQNLAWLFKLAGNWVECKRLLTRSLKLWRERGNDHRVALMSSYLSDVNRLMGLGKEGIQQAREASGVFERLGNTVNQVKSLIDLAWALNDDRQLDAAGEAGSHAINLLPEKGEQLWVCEGHRVLGNIYWSKGATEKAIHHFEVALEIGSSLNQVYLLFWVHFSLAGMFSREGRFGGARAHVEHAKLHTIGNAYNLGRAMELQANLWYRQHVFEKAKFEASYATSVFEKVGATEEIEDCRKLLREIDKLDLDGEPLGTMVLPARINVPF